MLFGLGGGIMFLNVFFLRVFFIGMIRNFNLWGEEDLVFKEDYCFFICKIFLGEVNSEVSGYKYFFFRLFRIWIRK